MNAKLKINVNSAQNSHWNCLRCSSTNSMSSKYCRICRNINGISSNSVSPVKKKEINISEPWKCVKCETVNRLVDVCRMCRTFKSSDYCKTCKIPLSGNENCVNCKTNSCSMCSKSIGINENKICKNCHCPCKTNNCPKCSNYSKKPEFLCEKCGLSL